MTDSRIPATSADAPASLDRRRALGSLAALGGLASAGLAPVQGLTAALPAPPALADDAAFRAADPRLAPLRGLADGDTVLRCDALAVRGRWPAGLSGTFFRNGPALFERGGERYRHWFAGDGMVQRFACSPRGVSHTGRFVRTPKLRAEQAAGHFVEPAYASPIAHGDEAAGGGPDAMNVANTSVLQHGGRLLALWEGGSAFDLDPRTLATRGAVTWGDGLAQMPFSAHPKVDPQGHLWNIGTFGDRVVVWHVGPDGRLVDARAGALPYANGMAHDMAVTERWIVLPLPPVKMDYAAAASGTPAARAFRFEAEQPLRVLVMNKDDIADRRVFELPSRMVFHVANAHEERDGTIVLGYCAARDAGFLVHGAVHLAAGRPAGDPGATETCIARLDPRSGRATVETFRETVEFPRIDPRRVGQPARRIVTAYRAASRRANDGGLLHGVQVRDTATGRVDRFDYGADAVAEEHVVVPKPGATAERDAWLVGTRYEARRGVTVLAVLDAARVAEGPLAEASLPYALPFGFHGHFEAAPGAGR